MVEPTHNKVGDALTLLIVGTAFTLNVELTPVTEELHPVEVNTTEVISIVVDPVEDNTPVVKLAAPVPPLVVIEALPLPVLAPLSV